MPIPYIAAFFLRSALKSLFSSASRMASALKSSPTSFWSSSTRNCVEAVTPESVAIVNGNVAVPVAATPAGPAGAPASIPPACTAAAFSMPSLLIEVDKDWIAHCPKMFLKSPLFSQIVLANPITPFPFSWIDLFQLWSSSDVPYWATWASYLPTSDAKASAASL